MRVVSSLSRTLALGTIFTGLGALPLPMDGGPGIASAEAKGFYTRKRINGVWVEGRFPKAAVSTRGRGLAGAGTAVVAGAVTAQAANAKLAPPAGRTLPADPVETAAAASVPTTGTLATSKPEGENMAKLQEALERRAREVRGQGAAAVAPSPAPAARGEPKSVSLDFETGIKTTTYAGNVSVRESFDLSAGKALASPPPPAAAVTAPAAARP